jgi:2-dehydropantoate 2-reductase
MKIGVVGCGAVGSYYGAKLWRDNHEVHFLLRSDYNLVRRRGVRILSPEINFTARPRAAAEPGEIGPCDLVLIALKTTANFEIPRLVAPLVDSKTTLLTLQNGLGNEEALAVHFPIEQIMGGVCIVCLVRTEPGVIHHTAQGKIVIGEARGWPEPRTHDIASAFRHAGVPCDVTEDVARTRWEKLVWNIAFNGLGVASAAGYDAVISGAITTRKREACLATDALLRDERWLELLRTIMNEVVSAARAQGLKVPEDWADVQISITQGIGSYKASTVLDFEQGRPLELESIFLEPLRRAREAGLMVPRWEAMTSVLNELSRERTESGMN